MPVTCDRIVDSMRCGKVATISDHARQVKEGLPTTPHLCLACARELHPDLFPMIPRYVRKPLNITAGKTRN